MDITLKFTFELENGLTRVLSLKDVKEDITEAEIKGLAESFIKKGLEYKGSKLSLFKKCDKVASSTETFLG